MQELSPQIHAVHGQQQEACQLLAGQRAPALTHRLTVDLPQLREAARAALSSAQQSEAEWRVVESDMYKTLQPFSLQALQLRMDAAVTEAEQLCESLAASFLEERASSEDSVAAFIKQYRKERKTYHMRKEAQDRWKEERVGRAY